VVIGPSVHDVADVVLALHFLLFPLKWVLASFSILPASMLDYLDSPTSFLVGTTERVRVANEAAVIFDLAQASVKMAVDVPRIPHMKEFQSQMQTYWEALPTRRAEMVEAILDETHKQLQTLLEPLQRSILTNFSWPQRRGSTFVQELFIATFPIDNRWFAKALCETQMMQFYVEHECRRRTEQWDDAPTLSE
jgi:hypothetical protein